MVYFMILEQEILNKFNKFNDEKLIATELINKYKNAEIGLIVLMDELKKLAKYSDLYLYLCFTTEKILRLEYQNLIDLNNILKND